MRAVPIGTVLNLRTPTSQKCAAIPRRAHIQGSYTFVSLTSRLESDNEEEKNFPDEVTNICPAASRKFII